MKSAKRARADEEMLDGCTRHGVASHPTSLTSCSRPAAPVGRI
jgi:hypothetical protein